MGEKIKVGMADLNICRVPDTILTLGLGSCVGIVIYDKNTKICGMLHAMLPDSTQIKNNSNRSKFVDTGLADLLSLLEKNGVQRKNLEAKIAGGAHLFNFNSDVIAIGNRNIEAAKSKLKEYGIRLVAEDTGSNYGRTIEFDPETCMLEIRAVGKEITHI